MKRSFQLFAYTFLFIIGAFLFGITSDGHIIKICIACNSFTTNLFGVVSILIGIVGFAGTIGSKTVGVNSR